MLPGNIALTFRFACNIAIGNNLLMLPKCFLNVALMLCFMSIIPTGIKV